MEDEQEFNGNKENSEEEDQAFEDSEIEMITKNSGNSDMEKLYLPIYIKLTNLKPGEPQYMKLRSPYVVTSFKVNRTKNPHEFYLSQLQLYHLETKPIKIGLEVIPSQRCPEVSQGAVFYWAGGMYW